MDGMADGMTRGQAYGMYGVLWLMVWSPVRGWRGMCGEVSGLCHRYKGRVE
jgi:hypothetical protein